MMITMRFTLSVLFSVILILNVITTGVISADRILFLLPIASTSHHHVFEPLIRALGERGHDIVSLSPVKSKMPGNVKQVQILTVDQIFGDIPSSFASRQAGKFFPISKQFYGLFDYQMWTSFRIIFIPSSTYREI